MVGDVTDRPKQLAKSRIVHGSNIAVVMSIVSLLDAISRTDSEALQSAVQQLFGAEWAALVPPALAFVGAAVALYARVDDHLKGRTR